MSDITPEHTTRGSVDHSSEVELHYDDVPNTISGVPSSTLLSLREVDMPKHLKTLEKVIDSLMVKSLVDGNMLIEIKYKGEPVEEGAAAVGIYARLAIADEISALLYAHIGKVK